MSGVDLLGNCLRCGVYVVSSGGCNCAQARVRSRTFRVTVEEIMPVPEYGIQTTTLPDFQIVWETPIR